MDERRFEQVVLCLSIFSVVVCMFLPLVVISGYEIILENRAAGAESVVGVAVILRAAARRVLQGSTSNLMRTTLGTYSRASTRALTRRLVRLVVFPILAILTRRGMAVAAEDEDDTADAPGQHFAVAMAVGLVALAASFGGILLLADASIVGSVTGQGEVSLWVAAVLAALPLLVYASATRLVARAWNVEVKFRTALDGLLLQGYFTGAGSFLPMTTDIEYEKNHAASPWVAAITLGALYVCHLALLIVSSWTESYAMQFAATMFLLYGFVYSFPIAPLEGYHLWRRSKLLWAAFWGPILFSFLTSVPEAFSAIL